MQVKKLLLNANGYPDKLSRLAQPPQELFVAGPLNDLLEQPIVSIVGSRKVSPYGRAVTTDLASKLAKQGIVIMSGLALGVDALAHQAALEVGGATIAVLPSSLDNIYPTTHYSLATKIVQGGGALITEYPAHQRIYKTNFIARNRIVAGLCDALLITEAAEKSGSLHTARFALEQGIDVLAVPGNITSLTSTGTNNLIKSGATPITCAEDVLHALGLTLRPLQQPTPTGANQAEQTLLNLLTQGIHDAEELHVTSKLELQTFNQTLTMLEITGKVRSLGANRWSIA